MDEMGLNQHHDAITGTDSQFVAEDYKTRLSRAQGESGEYYSQLL